MARIVTVIPKNQTINGTRIATDKKLRTAAYCRVSTDREEQENSFENQVEYYTKYIKEKPEYEFAGIYADEGISGTGVKKRRQFQQMIKDCEDGKIDFIITKSISRFARNTADCLYYSRMLKNLGISIYFEKENIRTTDASGELLFTILSSLAQEESRNISENCKWGIRSRFQKGVPQLNPDQVMGYEKGENREFLVNKEQAKLVKRIYKSFEEGLTYPQIAHELNSEGICGVKGKPSWNGCSIRFMLQNELYKGDVRMQKSFTYDYLTKRQKINEGELAQYYIENNHPAIIDKEEWEAVQLEIERRNEFIKRHGLKQLGPRDCDSPFIAKVFCDKCGGRYGRKKGYWKCYYTEKEHGKNCSSENIKEENLRKAMVITWNYIVLHKEQFIPKWEDIIENGNPLEKLRARQLMELAEAGPIEKEVPELTRMILEEITVINSYTVKVKLLDGNERMVTLA